MPFTTNLSGTAQLDNSIVLAFDQGFIVSAGQAAILEALVEWKADIGAKSIGFPKYGRLALATTPLTETDDVTSEALSDSEVILTPREYGKSITRTALASFQTGGKVDLAAATLVGMNMAQTQDALIVAALQGSANQEIAVVSGAQLDGQFSKLAAKSVMPVAGGAYVALMSEAECAILRNEAGFIDVAKYGSAEAVLRNEIGFYKGHKIVRHQGVTAGTVISLGHNAVGKAVSREAGLVLSGPFDKLGRFVNVGWYGVFAYGLVDTDAVELLVA
jgi:N4-gp56 family major capsid protein